MLNSQMVKGPVCTPSTSVTLLVVIEKLDSLNGPAQNAKRAISESLPLTTNSTNT